MRIVYVGDNRNRGNFGCRGTSTALSQLISQNNEIVGRISGRYTNFDTGELYFRKGLSLKTYTFLSKLKCWPYLKKFLYLYHRYRGLGGKFLFSKYDFISLDLDNSIDNLIKCLPANPRLAELDLRQYDFDALVVNGEGSFIFATPPWRECLIEAMEMHWAQKMGKKVFYMNGMLSDDPLSKHNDNTVNKLQQVFNKCTAVCVREYMSLEYCNKYFPNAKPLLYPDALFTWYSYVNDGHVVENGKYYISHSSENDAAYDCFDFTKPYICLSGSSAIIGACKGNMQIAVNAYSNLVQHLKNEFDLNIFLVDVDEGDEFLNDVSKQTKTPIIPIDTPLIAAAKILANARIYISGRYHPAIMASLGGTPCVFMGSNSHKTLSVQQLLEYDNPIEHNLLPDDNECKRIVMEAKSKIDNPELRDKIKKRSYELCVKAKEMSKVLDNE